VNCTGNYTLADKYDQFCDFEIRDLESDPEFDCTKASSYGYHNNKPCVLLKINKVSPFFSLSNLTPMLHDFTENAKNPITSKTELRFQA